VLPGSPYDTHFTRGNSYRLVSVSGTGMVGDQAMQPRI
jgi:hypothetical protein